MIYLYNTSLLQVIPFLLYIMKIGKKWGNHPDQSLQWLLTCLEGGINAPNKDIQNCNLSPSCLLGVCSNASLCAPYSEHIVMLLIYTVSAFCVLNSIPRTLESMATRSEHAVFIFTFHYVVKWTLGRQIILYFYPYLANT